MKTALRSTLAAVAMLALLAACTTPSEEPMAAADGPMAPVFEVDPLWPKPLPNHWLLGTVIGVDVDDQDNVWIVHRGSSLEQKELYATWDPPHHEDAMGKGRVHDSMVLKFSRTGEFLMQIGKPFMGEGSHDLKNFKLPAKTLVDPDTNELYIADGYGNRRVIVLDADTGEYKRHWGAYGNEPDDTQLPAYTPGDKPDQFRTPVHGIALADDGMVYVCDRTNDRIQAFTTDGKFVKETWVEPDTLGDGSTFDVAISRDPEQKYLYVADGANQRIHILDRESLEVLTSFGDGGRQPGQFYAVHSVATDSMGNLYTTETYRGQRVQRFVYKGLAPVTKKQQGVVWPTD